MTVSDGWSGLADARSFEPPSPMFEIRIRLHGWEPGKAEVSFQFLEPGVSVQRQLTEHGSQASRAQQERIVEAVTREVSSALAAMY